MNVPFEPISRARVDISKHSLIFLLTESVRSPTRLSTKLGKTDRLYAVCRLEASNGLSYLQASVRAREGREGGTNEF